MKNATALAHASEIDRVEPEPDPSFVPKDRTPVVRNGVGYTRLFTGEVVYFSPEDLALVKSHSWSRNSHRYAGARIDGRIQLLHRLIFPQWKQIDHRNTNPLDNRRSNLRPASTSQNVANRAKYAGTTSRFKGVGWDKGRDKWLVQICLDRQSLFLGRFDDEEDAARAYDAKARELFGEYALCNFPPVPSIKKAVPR